MIYLSDHLAEHIPKENAFEAVLRLDGKVFREHKHRRTFQAELGGKQFFIKIHGHTGWPEILKNVLRLRKPTLTSIPEWNAIKKLNELGVNTTPAVGYGTRGWNPARLQSFIFTIALEGMIHLDDLIKDWAGTTGSQQIRLKRAVIKELATIARTLHNNGVNHRDFYLCHFLLPEIDFLSYRKDQALNLHVIDLHRAQIRNKTPLRAIIKDLSSLLFSSFDAGFTSRDVIRFMRIYFGDAWRDWVKNRKVLLRYIRQKAIRLYQSEHGRYPKLPVSIASF